MIKLLVKSIFAKKSNTIKLKRGLKIELKKNILKNNELAFIVDTGEAVIGTENGPVVFAKHGAFLDGITVEYTEGRAHLLFPYTYKDKKE